ncbi:MAG: hypothetical protein JW850_20885 [Thermoflexales bacterium]|nr:hypothetical protein [Thermoflexales bacterium]
MSTAIDHRQQLLKEIDGLSPRELEKIYQMVVFLKEEFIEPDEARYQTPTWIQAEQEATDAYARGGLPRFHSVCELAEYIESGIEETE